MADKFPVTKRTDVLPGENSFPKKKPQEQFLEAMNAPNTPRPADDPKPELKKDKDGFFDREADSYNVTYNYCDDADE